MTGNNSQQTAKTFILIFTLLFMVVFGFWKIAEKNINLQTIQVTIPKEKSPEPKQVFTDNLIMNVIVGTAKVSAEVAQSDEKKKLGLGMREKLDEGKGMLFVFNNPGPCPGTCGFWNKDMLFPIDIIWIRDGMVVDVYEHLPSYKEVKDFTVSPKTKVNYILEVPDGFIKTNTIKIGDMVTYATPLESTK